MNFCENCDNMLYMKIVETPIDSTVENEDEESNSDIETQSKVQNKIMYYCRCCNNQYPDLHKKDSCIFKINYNNESIKKQSFINKYIYDDITLPIAENMKCINTDCPGKSKPNIKYIQYDKDNMKYIYICMNCYEAGNPTHIW